MGDPETYRPEADQEAHAERDSIERLAVRLREEGIEDDELDDLRERAAERVDEAVTWAKGESLPDPEAAHDHVFTNPPEGVTTDEPDPDAGAAAGGDD